MKILILILLFLGCIQESPKKPYIQENGKIVVNVQTIQAAAAAISEYVTYVNNGGANAINTGAGVGTGTGSVIPTTNIGIEINDTFSTSEELYGIAKTSLTIKKKDGTTLVSGTDYTYGQDITFYDTGSCSASLATDKLLKICFSNINIFNLGITKITAKNLSTIQYPIATNTAYYDPAKNTLTMPGAITWYEYTGYYGKGNKIINGLNFSDSTSNSTSANLASLGEATSPVFGYEFYSIVSGGISDSYSYYYSNLTTDTNLSFVNNSSYTLVLIYSKVLKTSLQFGFQDFSNIYDGFKIDQTNSNLQQVYCNNVVINSTAITGSLYDTNNAGTPNKTLLYWGVNGNSYDLSSIGTPYSITGIRTNCNNINTNTPRVISINASSGTGIGTTQYYFKGALKLYPFMVDKSWIQQKFISGSTYDFNPMLPQYCSLSNCNLGKFADATIRYYK